MCFPVVAVAVTGSVAVTVALGVVVALGIALVVVVVTGYYSLPVLVEVAVAGTVAVAY